MVMSALIVVYGQACVMSVGMEGSGLNEMSNGRAFWSEGRCSIGSTWNFDVGSK